MDMDFPADYQYYFETVGGDIVFLDPGDLKTINIFSGENTDFTAEELLNIFLPLGYVVSVQKTVEERIFISGMVSFSNDDESVMVMRKLMSNKDLLAGLSQPRDDRKDIERLSYFLSSSVQDRFSAMRPQRRVKDSPYQPHYKKTVSLRIENLPENDRQRQEVLSYLPPCTTNFKMVRGSAIVTLSDYFSAITLMDSLSSKGLFVYIDNLGDRCPATRPKRRKWHQRAPRPALNPVCTTDCCSPSNTASTCSEQHNKT